MVYIHLPKKSAPGFNVEELEDDLGLLVCILYIPWASQGKDPGCSHCQSQGVPVALTENSN